MPTQNKLQTLQHFLSTEIPLLTHMQLKVTHFDEQCLHLTAPLAPNSNHHNTAFGGSIATLGIACGWAYAQLRLQAEQLDCHLVIQKSEVEYLAPVTADFTAQCQLDDAGAWQVFIDQLKGRGKSRIQLPVTTWCGQQVVARHNSIYVAQLPIPPGQQKKPA